MKKQRLIQLLRCHWPKLLIWALFTVFFLLNFRLSSYQIADDSFRFFFGGTEYYKNLYVWNAASGAGGVATNTLNILIWPLLQIVDLVRNAIGGLGAQAVFSYALFLSLPFSMWLLTGVFTKRVAVRLSGTLLYALNIMLLRNWLRNIMFIDMVYVVAPVLIYLGYKYLTTKKPKYLVFIFLLQIVNAMTGLNPAYFFIEVAAVNIFLVYFCFAHKARWTDWLKINLFAFSYILAALVTYVIFFFNKGALLSDAYSNTAIAVQVASQIRLNSLQNVLNLLNADILSAYGTWGGHIFYPFAYVVTLSSMVWFWWLAIIPVLVFAVLLLRHRRLPFLLYISGIFLTCVFVVKGAAEPLGSAFQKIILSGSVGTIFRNPQQKFGYIMVLALVIGVVYALGKEKNRRLANGMAIALIVYSLVMAGQLFSGKLFTPYSFSKPPEYYRQAASYMNSEQTVRTIYTLPYTTSDFQYMDFGYEGFDLFKFLSPSKKIYERKSGAFSFKSKYVNSKIEEYFRNQPHVSYAFSDVMREYGIDTVVFHRDFNSERIRGLQIGQIEQYEQLLGSDPGLLAPKTFGKIDIYRLKPEFSPGPVMSASNAEYRKISPVEYVVSLKGVRNDTEVELAETYHPGWRIYPGQSDSFSGMSGPERAALLLQKPFADSGHMSNEHLSNVWRINLSEINSHSGNYVTKNSDGSYDIRLRLYFVPQLYFYAGVIITALVYTALITYLVRSVRRAR